MKHRMKAMFFCSALIALAASFFAATAIHAQDVKLGRSLAITDALRTAIANNKAIKIQEEEIAVAKGSLLYSKSLFLPQASIGYGYTYNETVLESSALPNHRKDTRIFSGYESDNTASVDVTETFYNGGANIATLKQAKLNVKVQRETVRAARLAVEFDTKRLFYGLLLAYENKRIAQELVSQAEAHYKEVKAKYDTGTASKFDLLQSKVQISTSIPQLVNAENQIDLLMAEFKKVLSIPMKENVVIDGKLDYKLIDIKEDEFLQEAYINRPEMILKSFGIDISKWAIEFAKAGWLPQVTGNFSYAWYSNNIEDMINPRHDNWSAGVQVSLNVFDGFSTKAKVDQAKAQYGQAVLQRDDVADQTAVNVRDACANLKQSKAIIDSQKDSVEEAREAVRLSEERYKTGVGINLDVLDAQVSLAQVEQNLASGIYDYIMATAQLDKVRGRESLKEATYASRP